MKRILKFIAWFILGVFLLVVGFAVFMQTTPGKRLLRNVVQNYLEDKFQTPVYIGEIRYKIPSMIGLEKVILIDKNKDTLLNLEHLQVDLEMMALLQNEVKVSKLEIDGLFAKMHRAAGDTSFNYQYIIDAFVPQTPSNNQAEHKDTSATATLFDVNKVLLKDITFIFKDDAGGTYFDIILDSLLLRPKTIDPSKMVYKVEQLIVYKASSLFKSFPGTLPEEEDTDTSATPLILQADDLKLIQSSYTMLTQPDSFYLDVDVGRLESRLQLFDLIQKWVKIDGLSLSESATQITMGKSPTKTTTSTSPANEPINPQQDWKVSGNKISMAGIQFKMDDNAVSKQGVGMDYSHLDVQQFSIILDDLYYTSDTISGDLTHLALTEKSGLDLRELKTNFVYHQGGAVLDNLYLMTPGTLIQDKILVRYPSLAQLSKDPSRMFLALNLNQSKAAVNDILIFTPASSRAVLLPYQGQQMNFSGKIEGYLSYLQLDQIEFSGLGHTRMALTGNIKGLPNPENLMYDFKVDNLQTSYQDIRSFIPKSVSDNIQIPQLVKVSGTIKGTMDAYEPDLKFITSDGNIALKGKVNMSQKNKEKYDLQFQAEQFNLGKLIKKEPLFGIMTMSGTIAGTGFDMKTMDAEVKGNIQRFDFQGYAYHNVLMDATLQKEQAQINLNSKDPNADLNMVAQVDLSKEYPAVRSTANIQNINLQSLGFVDSLIILAGVLDFNFLDLNPDWPLGYLSWKEPVINYQGKLLDVDSIFISSSGEKGFSQNLSAFIPDFINLSLTGNIPLTQVSNATMVHLNNYFTFYDTLNPSLSQYDLQFKLGAKYHKTLATFIPELKDFDTIDFKLDVSPSAFVFEGNIPNLQYENYFLKELKLSGRDSLRRLNCALGFASFTEKDGIQVFNPLLKGHLYNDSLLAMFNTTDEDKVENYAVGVQAHFADEAYYAKLLPNLKLNYDLWSVSNNEIAFSNQQGFYIQNLGITKGNESIRLHAVQGPVFGSPLDVKIHQFELANFSRILNPDTLLAEGTLDADFELKMKESTPLFNGNISIPNLSIYETPLGNLAGNVFNKDDNEYGIDLKLTENNNDLQLSGVYYLEPVRGNNLNMNLSLAALQMKSLEGLTFGNLKGSSGYLSGDLKINGLISAPKINGSLFTHDLQTKISMFNAPYKMPKEEIKFTGNNIVFDNFNILDSFGNIALLNGKMKTQDFTDFDVNLKFEPKRWMSTNSTKNDYENFYGRTIVSGLVNLTGTLTAPTIDGNIVLHDSTHFVYANIDEVPGADGNEGVVKFVDNLEVETPVLDSLKIFNPEHQMTMNLNIETEKYARFDVLVDPLAGDNASVYGAAFINAAMDPGGNIALSGNYTIEGGYYELFIELIKKRFSIKEGSSIQLAGDPMDAVVNIEAVYDVSVAPYDLMEKTASQEDLVYYKQRLPFQVLLKITGKPLSPIIAFEVILPEEKENQVNTQIAGNIQSKLKSLKTDPAEMNKQVFGLLVLNRFIADDPIRSGTPVSMEYYARQSASRFLSQALNNLASQYVNGLDLTLDVQSQEDYTTGSKEQRTSVNLNASKKFFNDRLTVNVGNDFVVEGRALPGRDNAFIPGNISFDYKLTRDGKYSLKAYRKNEIQNLLDGYVVETGLALRLNYEYNRIRQLFKSQEQLRKEWREQREKEMEAEKQKEQQEKEAALSKK